MQENRLESPRRLAVIFDAFGTLLQIRGGCHPYRQLIRIGMAHGRRPQPTDVHRLMQEPLDLAGAAMRLGIEISAVQLADLSAQLAEEISQIEPFPDALEAIRLLRQSGIAVAVCSNLAMPYIQAVERWFPDLDAYLYSCTLGVMKPHPDIYMHGCQALGSEPVQTVMIGDSPGCDRDGPRQSGLRGYYLTRAGGGGDFNELVSFARHVLGAPAPLA